MRGIPPINRDYELESSRVRYNADAEQFARDMYITNMESNRAFKRWRQEKNYVAVRVSKRRRYYALINATRYPPPPPPPPYGQGSGIDIASYQTILRYAVKSSLSKGSGFDH